MDRFGVQKPELKRLAKKPEIPEMLIIDSKESNTYEFFGGQVKNLETPGEVSATGMDGAKGILVLKQPLFGNIVDFELQKGDVIVKLNDQELSDSAELVKKSQLFDENIVKSLTVRRDQRWLQLMPLHN